MGQRMSYITYENECALLLDMQHVIGRRKKSHSSYFALCSIGVFIRNQKPFTAFFTPGPGSNLG